MAHRFLMVNVNHCARAQDLLHQSMAQWSTQVCIVTEPYFVHERDNWAGDSNDKVAIITNPTADSPPFGAVRRGQGCVAVLVGEVVIVGAYFSPNRSIAEFEAFLAETETLLSGWGRPHHVIVAGDLNAKSVAWGSRITDLRGELLEDWLLANGLVVLNQGTAETCVRMQGGSVVDVTFASPALARRVQSWEVLEEVETLSDHKYVRFDIFPDRPAPVAQAVPR
ncbi:uncharacterized protein LOC114364398 [Ostrinia furnacalis]|uniref:uncharacterized protein LOC114364398 n=1 Tax=Ostrinia furnacalis TaxID=93504 RepID=UPI00103F9386|nr:uncharacterized protein LOC114364398 [Ostrinia furnacalis]